MKAAVYDGNSIKIRDMEEPELLDGHVMIRVESAGICGTDLAIVDGHLPTPTPIILGHEFSGQIIGVGKHVSRDYMNLRVTSEINTNICGSCYFCKTNVPTNCINRKALGIDVDGAFAEKIAVHKDLVSVLPENVSYDAGSMIEPLAAAINTYELMPLSKSDKTIVIFGDGKLGQLIVQVTAQLNKLYPKKISNNLEVVLVGHSDTRLAIAKKNGASFTFNAKKVNPSQKILEMTSGLGADIVIDSTGNSDAFQHVVKSTRTRGKIGLKSTHGLPVPINMTDIVVREITMYGTRCGPFDKAIEIMEQGLINVDPLIGARIPLDDIESGLNLARKEDMIKIIVKCNE